MTGTAGGTGVLVLVGTPIGNLGDLSPRAVEALRTADVIACEDTRRTRQLLTAAGVPAGGRLLAVHDHNEAAQVRRPARAAGRRAAGGGRHRRRDARHLRPRRAAGGGRRRRRPPGGGGARPVGRGRRPGRERPAHGRWCFEGFLPRKGRDRCPAAGRAGHRAADDGLFESPHRVQATVADLAEAAGRRAPGGRRPGADQAASRRCGGAPWPTRSPTWPSASPWASTSWSWKVPPNGSRPPRPTSRTPCAPAWRPACRQARRGRRGGGRARRPQAPGLRRRPPPRVSAGNPSPVAGTRSVD